MPDTLVLTGSPGGIALHGEIDAATVPQIDAAFFELSGNVTVDCTDVTFIDSAGFHALDRGYEAAVKRGATFTVSGLGSFQTRIATIFNVPYVC